MRDTSKAITPRADAIRASSELDRFQQELTVSMSLLARFGDPVKAVRTAHHNPGLATDGFTVVPMKVQHHTCGYFKTEYDRDAIWAATSDFVSSSVGEAIRNVYQHGHKFHHVRDTTPIPREVHGVVALKELSVVGPDNKPIKALLAAVMDAGPGIEDPAHLMINGIGNMAHGGQGFGMDVELKHSLVYVIRSAKEGWFVFDGFTYSKIPYNVVDPWSEEANKARVEPVGTIDLPSPGIGCQKIFLCPLETATEAEKKWLTDQILAALMKPAT